MNILAPDVSMAGNHDFDFGYPHLSKLIEDTKFPWVLSNIIDNTTSRIPDHLLEYYVLERAGVRIGVIGLVEKEWISTVPTWPENFEYRDAAEAGMKLSKILRDPNGAHRCDIIVALTHARVPNDITLAKALNALSPSAQLDQPIESKHGVDIILGGHDHVYYVSRGVTSWEGYDTNTPVLGAEGDLGDVLIVKSGTDFRDLSEFTLELADTCPGSVRRKVIKEIRGRHHATQPGSKKSKVLTELLKTLLSSVSSALKAPVCKTDVELDLRSELIRTREISSTNWFADVLRHAYDEALSCGGGTDGVFICAGTLRGDSVYGPGCITLGDIMEILPFEDPVVVLELDGQTIWEALESSLATWPAQEGRFPVISGFRVSWDSRRPPGQRVLGVWLVQETSGSMTPTPVPSASSSMTSLQSLPSGATSSAVSLIDGDPIPRERGGRQYRIVSREYMAQGHDGFLMLKGRRYLVDDESGQLMSSIVRKYLLGARYVNRMARLANHTEVPHLHPDTADLISREKVRREHYARRAKPPTRIDKLRNKVRLVATALRWSRAHYRDHINISAREHMSGVDCINGEVMRAATSLDSRVQEVTQDDEKTGDEDLVVIHPIVDGRLADEGRK
ncbi:Metallo-dependent phosphatase [Sparassis crispa]|uniref:Metallo-dependent phosphatase n=1 Tax=Sparassis crispa TaxID=139825 RepID=A0A401GWW3_9APHY|nr:Metallo-dependent phosphatase [Sparassis crispa]GBE86672.1 Metallo-dependent phosphatase [Sparassis crispa]